MRPSSSSWRCPISRDNQLRTEEEERAELLSNCVYDVTLRLSDDVEAFTFTSTSVIDFECAHDGAETFLNLRAPSVTRVVLNGRDVGGEEHRFDGVRLRLAGLRAGRNRVEVVAECAYGTTGAGMHRFRDPVDGAVYLYTQCEPFDAHRVLACFDQPSLKAPLTMHVQAPPHWTVCANAPVAATRPGPGATTWDFATTPPLPPYLFAVVAGDYDVIDGPAHGSVPLALLCRRSLSVHARAGAAAFFDITLSGLRYLEERYGYPYPFGLYNQVFVPEANMGAMENPGCVTFNEMFLFRGPVSELQVARRANVILHEMVHVMGFGDVVTMRDWGDLWLNETFATVEATIAVAALGIADSWADFAGASKVRALHQDQLSTTHPIVVDPPDTDSIRANFDGITYQKGAAALRQLIAWVGDESYVAGIRSYFAEFAWGNATRADFLAHQASQSGRDLHSWAQLWLETPGVNTLRATARNGAVAIEQTPDLAAHVLRPHRISVGFYSRDGETLQRRASVGVEVTGAQASVDSRARADVLICNDGDLTFAKLRFDDASLTALLAGGVSALPDRLARSVCWTALHDMTRDGELPASTFVEAVASQAAAETDATLLERLLASAVAVADHYSADARRKEAMGRLAALAMERLDAGSLPLVWARCLAGAARREPELDLLQGLADGTNAVTGLEVDDELRWTLLAGLAARGRAGEAAIDAALELDPSDIGRRRALACLGARPDAGAKDQAWTTALEDRSASRARLVALLAGFQTGLFTLGGFHAGGRDQLELTGRFTPRYLEAVAGVWESFDFEVARVITEGLFPRDAVSDGVIDAVEQRITDPELPWNAKRLLMEGRDGLRRAQRARAADSPG